MDQAVVWAAPSALRRKRVRLALARAKRALRRALLWQATPARHGAPRFASASGSGAPAGHEHAASGAPLVRSAGASRRDGGYSVLLIVAIGAPAWIASPSTIGRAVMMPALW